LGLERDPSMPATEYHFAYLCEIMRYLLAGTDVAVANLTRQAAFFSEHLQPWTVAMCDSIGQHSSARFYVAVSEFTRAFLSVEAQGFDMLV